MHHLNPSRKDFQTKIEILATLFFQKGFSPLEVTVNCSCSSSVPQKKKKIHYMQGMQDPHFGVRQNWNISCRVFEKYMYLISENLSDLFLFQLIPSRAIGRLLRAQTCLHKHMDQFCICQPFLPVLQTLPESQQANNRERWGHHGRPTIAAHKNHRALFRELM